MGDGGVPFLSQYQIGGGLPNLQFTILHRGPSIYVTEVESDLSSHTWVESVINGQPHSRRLAYFLTNEIQI